MARAALGLIRLFLIAMLSAAALADHPIKQHSDIPWASPQGFELTLDIAQPIPPNAAPKAMPVLIIFHGGGWLLNDKSIMTDLANAIARRSNIVTVNVNYRLLGDVNNTTTANQMVEDAMGAVLWVKQHIAQYGGDPEKVAVTGDSAGGHLAAMVTLAGRNLSSHGFAKKPLGFNPSYLPKGKTAEQVARDNGLTLSAAILSYAGFSLYDIAKNNFETASNPFWQWADVKPRGLFGDAINVAQQPEYYHAVSPNHYLIPYKEYALPPQFVLVGALDQMTTPESAKRYVETLKNFNQPVTFKVYEGKGHGFLDSGCNDYNKGCFQDLSQPVVADMIEFLERQLIKRQ
ncbi:MAG TPA: alpha/beta hydrolase [Marinagarivorans sp.]